MANKEQGSSKNIKKVAKYTLKEKRALKREKLANKGQSIQTTFRPDNPNPSGGS